MTDRYSMGSLVRPPRENFLSQSLTEQLRRGELKLPPGYIYDPGEGVLDLSKNVQDMIAFGDDERDGWKFRADAGPDNYGISVDGRSESEHLNVASKAALHRNVTIGPATSIDSQELERTERSINAGVRPVDFRYKLLGENSPINLILDGSSPNAGLFTNEKAVHRINPDGSKTGAGYSLSGELGASRGSGGITATASTSAGNRIRAIPHTLGDTSPMYPGDYEFFQTAADQADKEEYDIEDFVRLGKGIGPQANLGFDSGEQGDGSQKYGVSIGIPWLPFDLAFGSKFSKRNRK